MLKVVSDPNKRAMSPFFQTSHVFCEKLILGMINSLNQRLSREPFILANSPFNEQLLSTLDFLCMMLS